MAKPRLQIQPRISEGAKQLLDTACEERGCSSGDVVDAALKAYLDPQHEAKLDAVLRHQAELRGMVSGLLGLLETVVQGKEETAPKIATYAELYGPVAPETDLPAPCGTHAPHAVSVPRLRGWKRFFFTETQD